MLAINILRLSARLAVGLAFASFCSGAVLNRSAKQVTPAGLQPVDWKQIRAEYERHRHAAFPDPIGWQARNFQQQWLTRFDGRGFTVEPDGAAWRFGLERAGVTSLAAVSHKVNRVTYRWSEDLDEWFLNDTRGLEHGFTLRAPQPDLRLSVRGGLKARTSAEGFEFVDASGTARVKYTGLKAWDATGRTLKARLDLEESGVLVLHVEDRGAQYPVEIDPLVEQAALAASNLEANDGFGSAVAISGNTLVVGAPSEDSNATGVNGNQANNSAVDSGAAYVFVRSGQTWTQEAYLKASNTEAADAFGQSVSISGDTVVIGARTEGSNSTGVNGAQNNNSALQSGAVYVFTRAGSVWSQQAYLKASNTRAFAGFGFSVAVSGNTAVVGSPFETGQSVGVNGSQSQTASTVTPGAAYIFQRAGTVWTQRAYLKADVVAGVRFGQSVALSSGLTPVAGDTILVGAPYQPAFSVGSAAYVFVFDGSNWVSQAKLQASNFQQALDFGWSVALSGDTAAVGAPSESVLTEVNSPSPGGGAAYVFTRTAGNWSQQARIKGPFIRFRTSPFSGTLLGPISTSSLLSDRSFGRNVALDGERLFIDQSTTRQDWAYCPFGLFGSCPSPIRPQTITIPTVNAVTLYSRTGTSWTVDSDFDPGSNGFSFFGGASALAVSGDSFVVGSDPNANNNFAHVELFVPAQLITIASLPAGRFFTTTGTGCAPSTYTAPQTLSWTVGSACTVAFTTPQSGSGGIRYPFLRWEDNSTNPTRAITAPASGAIYTANFSTEYLLTTTAGAGGTVSAGGYLGSTATATATATPNAGFAFVNFTGTATSTANPFIFPITAPTNLTANFAATTGVNVTIASNPAGRAFTVTGAGCAPGSGVTPQVLSWTPGSTCAVSYVAVQSGGAGTQFVFSNWEDSSTNVTRAIAAPSAAATYTATFNTQYQLTTTAGAGGTVSAGGFFNSGITTNITATPNAGFAFVNFTGAATSTNNPLSLLMDAPKAITANFAVNTVNVTVASNPVGRSFTSSGAGCPGGGVTPQIVSWTQGSTCTVSFTPLQSGGVGTQFAFSNWEDNSTNATRTIIAPSSAATYTASFNTQYQLTTTAGAGGSVSAGDFFNSGATANITATANVGFTFVNFTGAATSTSNPLSLLIDAPKSITANFAVNTVNVTVNSLPAGRSFTSSGVGCPGGGVTPQLLAWTPGANCLVTFNSPQSGGVGTQFTFARWEDNSTSPTRAITAPAAPATLTATFDTQYQLTTAAGTGGSVSAGGFFNSGATASITAMPSAGYSFLNFTGAANSISNPLGLLMDAPKSVSANFTLSAPPLLTATIASKVDGPAANERIWTVQVTNTGAGAALNPRIASVQILAGAPAANLGLVSLGSTVYPAALPVTTLNAGQSTTLPIRILFPATTPATRLQIRINLISDSGYTNSITLSNVTR